MNSASIPNRNESLQKAFEGAWDVVIIGGGITGAGIALDAASRGLATLLLDKNDFSSGTSSRSTKLVHGGLRYLKQFEVGLVREVGRERARLHSLAPCIIHPEKMVLPILRDGSLGRLSTSAGVRLYDFLAGVGRKNRRRMLSRKEMLSHEPLLDPERVKGGCEYVEYRTDDGRLTIEVIKTAVRHGACCLNYLEGEEFIYNEGRIGGLKVKDRIKGSKGEVKGKTFINATGPWVDLLREKDSSAEGKTLHLTKGVHIVVPHHALPLRHSVYFDHHDGRMIFAIPRDQCTYIGTTDTDHNDSPDNVEITEEDISYLLDAVRNLFRTEALSREDIISGWAGLRPLIHEEGKDPSEISRKDEIIVSDSGLISMAGGKLTGYRIMAKKTVDLVCKKLAVGKDHPYPACQTGSIPLQPGMPEAPGSFEEVTAGIVKMLAGYGLGRKDAEYLVANYGPEASRIVERMHETGDEDPELRLYMAELWYAIRNEMVIFPLDFFLRRTGNLYFRPERVSLHADELMDDFSQTYGWSDDQYHTQKQLLEDAMKEISLKS